jgi:hypothetical protein
MIEGLGLFLAGWMLNWTAFAVIIVLGILMEANEHHKTSVTLGIIAAVTAYYFFKIPLNYMLYGFGGYVVVGLAWSVWRYNRHVDSVVEKFANRSKDEKRCALREIHLRNMLDTITVWVIIWPFSMIENVAGDLVNIIQTTIKTYFKGVYMAIFNRAAKSFDIDPESI